MGTKQFDSATDLITFTRASGGTALRKISYGSELVTNGDFATNSDWTLGDGWTISGGVAVGTNTFRELVSNTTTIIGGRTYIVTFEITSYTAGRVKAKVGGTLGTYRNSVGVYTEIIVATNTDNARIVRSDLNFTGSIDNISVKEVLYDQPSGTLQLYNHLDNTPRIEYNADGTVKGLLIEEARTNLQPDNNSLETKSATNLTTTANATTAPDGKNTAVKLTIDAGETESPRLLVGSGQDNPSNVSSIFAKAGEGSFNKIGLGAWNYAGYTAVAYFDLTTGTFDYIAKTSNRDISDYGIEPVGNGWYRIWIKPLNDSGVGFVFVASDDSTVSSGKNSATAGNGSDGLYIWGHQVEAGAFPTSYIPTTGSTATRAADVASIPVSAFGYNQKAGSIVVDFNTNNSTTSNPHIIDLTDNTNNNRIIIQKIINTTEVHSAVKESNTLYVDIDNGDIASNVSTKVAFGFANNNFASNMTNGSFITDTTGNMPSSITKLNIGSKYNSTNISTGHIKSIKYYPRRLSDTQLQELTT